MEKGSEKLMIHVGGSSMMWVAARALLRARGEEFFTHLNRAANTSTPEDIHDLRVASRRLREGLILFAPCFPAADIFAFERKIKKVTRLLGDIRNTDEAILFFSSLNNELDPCCHVAIESLREDFQKIRQKEIKRVGAALGAIGSEKMHKLFRRIVNSPRLFNQQTGNGDLFAPISQFAGRAIIQRLASVKALLPEVRGIEDTEAQHQLRIAIKHLRYRMEILSFLVGKNYEEIHAVLKRYQDVLGELHDLLVFTVIIRNKAFPTEIEEIIIELTDAKKREFFGEFEVMLQTRPLTDIDEQLPEMLRIAQELR